jgi:hypothetical protein
LLYNNSKDSINNPLYDFLTFRKEDYIIHAHAGINGLELIVDQSSTDPLDAASDLRSETEKLVVVIMPSIAHTILDGIALMAEWFDAYPEAEIIILEDLYIHNPKDPRSVKYDTDVLDVCIAILQERGAKITRITGKILINNFYEVSSPGFSIPKTVHTYRALGSLADGLATSEKPYRKVYISRSKINGRGFSDEHYTNNSMLTDDCRVYNEEHLEQLFVEMGFEIVYFEEMGSFVEQMSIMKESKIVAGVSGAGLTSSVFMRPGTTVVEISTLILAPDSARRLRPSWHHHLSDLAFSVNLNKVSVPVVEYRDGIDVASRIRSTPMFDYLKNY